MEDSRKIYHLVPHQGVEPVLLGMSRAESRAAMNVPVKPFQKTPNTPEVDGYHGSSFQVFFDENDNVDYIELSKAWDCSFIALYQGLNVHETEANDALEFIKKFADFDENDRELGYSYVFPSLDLSVWRPTIAEIDQDEADDDGRFFLTIGVGVKGLFKKQITEGL